MMDDSESFQEDFGNFQGQRHRAPRRRYYGAHGHEEPEIKMKVDLPFFNGRMDVENFLDWTKNVENFFEYTNTHNNKKSQISGIQTPRRSCCLVGPPRR